MSVVRSSAYTTRAGDTTAAIAARFRLSSPQAITEVALNRPLKSILQGAGGLPAGLLVHIPPNAIELLRERLFALDKFRPILLSHFVELDEMADALLRDDILQSMPPLDTVRLQVPLARLGGFVDTSMDTIVRGTKALVRVCQAMTHTHVAERNDFAVVNDGADPRVGVYWAVTPGVYGAWLNMWDRDTWAGKWHELDVQTAWERVPQHITTIRSLVVQQVDQRIREARALERQLRSEAS
jgi:hypothetical protein